MNRVLLRTSVALVLLAAAVLVVWRVLAPAEVLASATTPYPPISLRPPAVTGRTNLAPLVVDGRLRVYATKHQVKADGPVDGQTLYTARWSFRRWPEQLSGVAARGATVITRWSDGELVAIDARTGKITWRQDGPDAPGYAGHRTGAAAVWTPPGLRLAAGTVVVTADQNLVGYDLSTGAVRWRISTPPGCAEGFTTSGGAYVCATGAYDVESGVAIADWPAGPFEPIGCDSGGSDCAAFRDCAGQGRFADSAVLRRVPALDAAGATVAAGVIVTASDAAVSARSAEGEELWSRSGAARILGGTSANVVLLTAGNTLVAVNARTGVEAYSFPLAYGTEKTEWRPGGYRLAGRFLAMERLNVDAPDDPESPIYYLTLDTVIIAAL
ncbi:outer membrane protein assembly factor BamB family protein [Actinoplanes aureus]|uniref:PQQ-binding-like beta-propeller repeat protein n=1 Tax=Actinoplanes aureus TaxID=2792083 RepID=A0A931CJ40_9ACTN|nr:PQQ-binding-like beta-propeller repeat protein [Actinoplanes aureus]MBG0568937.1 PQQ-binding-like beta-propeller repeat protein [Actinoplanes aureus]